MSEQEEQAQTPPKHPRSRQETARATQKTKQPTAAGQPAPPPGEPAQAPAEEPPIGERWGEFPPVDLQAVLRRAWNEWEQDHDKRPFAKRKLTGADVYWLAALAAGAGEVEDGLRALNDPFPCPLFSLHLEGAILREAHLEGARLYGAQLEGADLFEAHLEGAHLYKAHLKDADLRRAHLKGVILTLAHLEGTHLDEAQLEGAYLNYAQLKGAILYGPHLEDTDLSGADLTRQVDLRRATLDLKTQLVEAHLDATLKVADVSWNGVPLSQVAWEEVPSLGDEAVAHQTQTQDGLRKSPDQRQSDFEAAARAYRQLAVALRGQGISEAADRFTYRALIMQRKALWWQIIDGKPSKIGAWLFSGFLAALTGYGFRMGRLLIVYALVITGFASAYHLLGNLYPPALPWNDAFVLSITAFHGRVFSSPFMLGSPQGWVTALEAIAGLLVEGVFIAMLTQRFFNR